MKKSCGIEIGLGFVRDWDRVKIEIGSLGLVGLVFG